MAWAAFNNSIIAEVVILYISAIFWTLGYDTIYGAQDMSDDEIIGLKSTSLKFKNNLGLFVSFSSLTSIALIFYLFIDFLGKNIFTFLLFMFALSLIYQIFELKKNKHKNYLKLFKFNNYTGLILFLAISSLNL